MTSPVTVTVNRQGKWEVRINDGEQKLLATFEDTTSRDLFVEAVRAIVLGDEMTAATVFTHRQLAA